MMRTHIILKTDGNQFVHNLQSNIYKNNLKTKISE